MKQESQRLEEEVVDVQKKLATMPPGKLICSRNGTRYKWYQSDGHSKIYIPKKNRALAEQLAEKQYLSNLLEDLLHEKRAIDFYLRHHRLEVGKSEKLLLNESEVQRLLSTKYKTKSKELQDWSKADYERYARYPEQLIYQGMSGIMLRSKSEVAIETQLYLNGIPFRYECELQIGGVIFHPDFTIRHPKTGKEYYWEHFGMMDEPGYARNAAGKIQSYISNGIIPSIQLITTYETRTSPLGYEKIKKILEEYFL